MHSYRNQGFKRLFAQLPQDVQEQADKAYEQFKQDQIILVYNLSRLVRQVSIVCVLEEIIVL